MILLKNANVCGTDFSFRVEDVLVNNEYIVAIGDDAGRRYDSSGERDKEILDLSGLLLIPGLIDIHIHGCAGFDTCDADTKALPGISRYLALHGITSFLPTTMTMSRQALDETVSSVRTFMREGRMLSKALGVHVEGPYLSRNFAGIQSPEDVRDPSIEEILELQSRYSDIIRLIDIAPELAGADAFIKEMHDKCTIALAHSDADYDTARESFLAGVSHVTHLFNAMRGMNHRSPGAVGAIFDCDQVTAELICDGYHIHPAVLRIAFRLLGEDRSVIVSDSMRAAGCPDGVYQLGGHPVTVRDGRTFMANQRPAGSVTDILQEMRNLITYGVPLRQIIKSATINPARVIGMDREIGSIGIGKRADMIALDPEFSLCRTMIDGKLIPVDGI